MNTHSHTRIVMWQFIQNIYVWTFLENNRFIQRYKWFVFPFSFHQPPFPIFHNINKYLGSNLTKPDILFHFLYILRCTFSNMFIYKTFVLLHTFQKTKMTFWFISITITTIHAYLCKNINLQPTNMYTINQWSNSVLRTITNQIHDIFSYNETTTIPFHSSSYVRSKPTIHPIQQHNNKPVYQVLAGGVWYLRLLAQSVLQALIGRVWYLWF